MTKARVNGTTSNAKGDLVVGTGSTTAAALSVGTDGQVLTAASGQTTGLQWATPASGSMTQIATGSLSGVSTVTISSISQTYKNLYLTVYGPISTVSQTLWYRYNGTSSASYYFSGFSPIGSSTIYSDIQYYLPLGWVGTSAADPDAKGLSTVSFPNYALNAPKINTTFSLNNNNIQKNIIWGGNPSDLTAITNITILVTSGSFSSGTYTLYGVN